MVLVVSKLFGYIHNDLRNDCLSILKWIHEPLIVPGSKFFNFIIQHEVKFIFSVKFFNVLPEQLVIFLIHFKLFLNLFQGLEVRFKFFGIISAEILTVNQFELLQIS